jgi:hypothetical protein
MQPGHRVAWQDDAGEQVFEPSRSGRVSALALLGLDDGGVLRLEDPGGALLMVDEIARVEPGLLSRVASVAAPVLAVVALLGVVALAGRRYVGIGAMLTDLRGGAGGAAVVIALALGAAIAALADLDGSFMLLLRLAFVFIAPGLLLLRALPGHGWREWTLVPAVGLTAVLLLSLTMLYAGAWQPRWLFAGFGAAVAMAGLVDLLGARFTRGAGPFTSDQRGGRFSRLEARVDAGPGE